MYGAYEFYRKAKKENIKPIIGIEAYVVSEGSRFDKGKSHESGNDGDDQQGDEDLEQGEAFVSTRLYRFAGGIVQVQSVQLSALISGCCAGWFSE